MAMKYARTLEDLKQLFAAHHMTGSWQTEPNGVHMMRCADGVNIHWASGSKSLWIDGKPAARAKRTAAISRILHELDE